MSTRSTGLLSRPAVYRASDESGRSASPRSTSRYSARQAETSETDVLLRRSQMLVEQLRRAVAARQRLL